MKAMWVRTGTTTTAGSAWASIRIRPNWRPCAPSSAMVRPMRKSAAATISGDGGAHDTGPDLGRAGAGAAVRRAAAVALRRSAVPAFAHHQFRRGPDPAARRPGGAGWARRAASLDGRAQELERPVAAGGDRGPYRVLPEVDISARDRKSVGVGQRVSGRVDIGGS